MKKNFVKLRWLFTMLLFVTTMIVPTMMLAQSIDLKIPEGDGAENPYQIRTREELYWFAGLVNGTLDGVDRKESANAILMNNITVNEGVLDAVNKGQVSESNFLIGWEPIGRHGSYTGTFDGNGYTISGLYFNNPEADYIGLFAHIGVGGKISDVGVLDSYFQFSRHSLYVGGVCGSNSGELQNCSNSSTAIGKEDYDTNYDIYIGGVCGYNSGTVKDCKNTGSVSGRATIGGVCGYNSSDGIIENSFNEGTVSGTGDNVGGVCGYNYGGTIKSCYNTASVSGQSIVGGVCGDNWSGTSTITNCFNKGTVSGQYYVGGVCGHNGGNTTNCFNEGTVSGQQYSVGGVCGVISSGGITNCFNKGTVSGQREVGGVCGTNYIGTIYSGTITNCYYLENTATGGINGQDEIGRAEKMSKEHFESGEMAWLLNGKGLGEQVWGQQLGIDPSPVFGSDYKVIKAAQGDKDANGNYTYWATFSNPTNDVTLSVPSDRTLNVYNATVSGGKMTLTERNNQVAKEEGVLLKTDGEYVNAKANKTNELTAASSDENHLVATPAEAQTVTAETGCKLYRLTYNKAATKEGLGFYLSVDKDNNSSDGTSLKATPGKAYLQISENEAKDPSSAALARSFVFGGGNETTGIEGITIMGTDVQRHGTIEGIFDLQGRKIVNPTKGIYIKNNKKVIIK